MPTRSLCLVHAHPDDESIATGGVIARAERDGHRVVVITCTGGEEGERHGPHPEGRPLAAIREAELRAACAVLGVDRLELLGYRDSGMLGSAANDHPASFHRAPLNEVARRLVLLLWAERPDVVVTYTADGTYGHPDHVKAHRATVAALGQLARAGWQPARVFWHALPRSAADRVREAQGGRTHPAMRAVGVPDHEITTGIDVRDLLPRKRAAVAAHVSQHPPDVMTAMAGQILAAMGGHEHFVLGGGHLGGRPRSDLFEGLTADQPTVSGAVMPSTTTW